ncbi:MAG TPA: 4,5-DOPA dioxygenase extradiol [Allosphingosinicella sp.]|nr:4,5-DOPA dioxygenase extradiol [Allosphingosinicella sp.]
MSELVERMPALFFGHGSPMNALGGPYADIWAALGRALPRPKAILCVSAHWYVDETAVTAMERPRTIHDFYGFPRDLYHISYPAPGDPWLAARTADLLAPLGVRADQDWGLDHGAWSVLVHAFPDADIPVVQLAIDRTQPPLFHYELGRRLAPLRDEGVLVCGSGDVVHNLRMLDMSGGEPFPWAARFNDRVKAMIEARDDSALVDYPALGEEAMRAIPTPDHYLPLLYLLGTRGADEPVRFFADRIALGSISMLGMIFGTMPETPSPMAENAPPVEGIA